MAYISKSINGIINDNLNKVDQELIIKDTQLLDLAESSKILADYLSRSLQIEQKPSLHWFLLYFYTLCYLTLTS